MEEYLKHSKQWLRTPVQVLVKGQLAYVPRSFFDAEAAARKHAADILGDIEKHTRSASNRTRAIPSAVGCIPEIRTMRSRWGVRR